MRRTIRAVVFLGALTWAAQVMAQMAEFPQEVPRGGTWEVGTGIGYSVGSYGTPFDTTAIEVPLDVSMQFERLRLEAIVPYLHIEGPYVSEGGVVVPGGGTRSGLGDAKVSVAWLFYRSGRTGLEVQGGVKFPTADSELGTDKVDYSAQANIYHVIPGGFFLFASAGYHWLGDYPAFPLDDGVFGVAGISYALGEVTSLGLTVLYHQKYLRSMDDLLTVTPSASWTLTSNVRLIGFGIWGLSDSSPDYGNGLRLVFIMTTDRAAFAVSQGRVSPTR